MKTSSRLFAAILAIVGFASFAPRGDAAEMYAIVANGQGILGTVPAATPIRLRFPLSEGASPTISLNLTGSPLTVSFREFRLFGPDGQEIVLDQASQYFTIRPHTNAGGGRDGLLFKGWHALESGFHELLISTNATVGLKATGKIVVARTRRFVIQGDENSPPEVNPVRVAMQGHIPTGIYEKVTIAVRRLSGTPPMIAGAKTPSGAPLFVSQTKTRRGSTTRAINTLEFGNYEFTVGYQTTAVPPAPPPPAAGRWRGIVTVTPFKGGYPATLALRNSPGVPLSVLDVDRFLNPPFGGTRVGVATDGISVLVTSEGGGNLYGEFFALDLAPPFTPAVVTMAGQADLPAGETLAGHRVISMGGAYFAAFSSVSGQTLGLARFNGILQKSNVLTVVGNSADSTKDFFLAGDGARVSVGVNHAATTSHAVYSYDGLNLGNPTTTTIGGALYPQAAGAGAAWRFEDSVFELWTPETLDYRGPSKLHRVLYSSTWATPTPDVKYSFADPSQTETMPSAVSVDAQTGVTIVHYVVADDPPQGALGTGRIHRRLFFPTGVEIPGSHVVLPRVASNRPASVLVGNRLFLAYETGAGPVVERYPLLRTQ